MLKLNWTDTSLQCPDLCLWDLILGWTDGWMDGQVDGQIPPVFYRTSFPPGPLPCSPSQLETTNDSSRAWAHFPKSMFSGMALRGKKMANLTDGTLTGEVRSF